MSQTFERWPFRPLDQLTEAQRKRWWQECFLPDRAYEILQNQPHWSILIGPCGSGRSTLLHALKHVGRQDDLVVEGTRSLGNLKTQVNSNLFYHMMSLATQELYYLFREKKSLLGEISQTQREYFRWLIEKFNGSRSYLVFIDGLDSKLKKIMETVPIQDIYPTQTELRDVQGQIDELVNICKSIGYTNLTLILDLSSYATDYQLASAANFLSWLEPMHHYGFIVITAVTDVQYQKYDLAYRTRGRVTPIYIQPVAAQTRNIVSRYLSVALGHRVQGLEEITGDVLAGKIETLVEKEFGMLVPGPLVAFAELVLDVLEKGEKLEFESIRNRFFAQEMPLRLDLESDRCGVWRGHQYIPLEKNVFELLKDLARKRKTESGKGYLHSRASKLRRAIEPDPSSNQRVYLKNTHDEGYWLENFVEGQVVNR